MIGYLAIYSHISGPNIVIESRKERLLQKILIVVNQHVTFINYFGGDIYIF